MLFLLFVSKAPSLLQISTTSLKVYVSTLLISHTGDGIGFRHEDTSRQMVFRLYISELLTRPPLGLTVCVFA